MDSEVVSVVSVLEEDSVITLSQNNVKATPGKKQDVDVCLRSLRMGSLGWNTAQDSISTPGQHAKALHSYLWLNMSALSSTCKYPGLPSATLPDSTEHYLLQLNH